MRPDLPCRTLYSRTAAAYARRRAEDPRIAAAIREALGNGEIRTVPISHDCRDGFLGAHWRRPQAYLDPEAQQAISALALLDRAVRERGLEALAHDLESGAWAERHAELLERTELDLGYRLLIGRHT